MFIGTVAGNLGQDADLRYAQQSGDAVLNFSVASNEKGKDGEKHTTWVRCVMFGKRAEAIHSYLRKGVYVVASGSVSAREYEPRDGGAKKTSIEMRVNEIAFHGGDRDGNQGADRAGDAGGHGSGGPAQAPRTGGGGYGGGHGGGARARSGNGRSAGARTLAPPADAGGPPDDGGGYGANDDSDIPF